MKLYRFMSIAECDKLLKGETLTVPTTVRNVVRQVRLKDSASASATSNRQRKPYAGCMES